MKYTLKVLSGLLAVISTPVALADNFSQLSQAILQNNAEIKAEVQRGSAEAATETPANTAKTPAR